jgi:hypothetical protein
MHSPHSRLVAQQELVVVQLPIAGGSPQVAAATGRLPPCRQFCAMFLDA